MARNSAVVDLQPRVDVRLVKRDFLGKLLDSLPDSERKLFLLKDGAGYSVEELSRMTCTPENTIKVKLFRVRRKLAKTAERLAAKHVRRFAA